MRHLVLFPMYIIDGSDLSQIVADRLADAGRADLSIIRPAYSSSTILSPPFCASRPPSAPLPALLEIMKRSEKMGN